MKVKNQSFKFMLATMVLIGIVAIFLYLYYGNIGPFFDGEKEFTVQIILPDEEVKEYTIVTEATKLGEALRAKNLIKVENGFINEVDGIAADSSNEEWWSIIVNGEFSNFGVEDIPIQDKDVYEFTFMVGF